MNREVHNRVGSWPFAVVVFALLAFAVYSPIAQGWIPFPRDQVLQFGPWWQFKASSGPQQVANIGDLVSSFYPFRKFAGEAVRGGTLPLWNPYLLAGTPFLANAQSALFYPLTGLYYLLPMPIGWAAALIVHLFLAGFFTWLFVKSIGGSPAGAILSGMIFACCGFITAWQGQAMGTAAVWLPLIFYAVHRLREQPSNGSVALTAFAFAMPVLAGHPETAVHVILAGIAWALLLWRFDRRFLFSFAAAGLLALGLAAVQILPTVEWIGQIGNRLEVIWSPLHLSQALAIVSRDALRNPNSASIQIPDSASYLGMASLLLFPFAAFHKNKRHAVFFGAIILISFGIVYGVEPFRWIAEHTPLLKTLKNGRMILIASFGVAVLAGLGLSMFDKASTVFTGRRRWIALAVVCGALLLSLGMVHLLQQATTFKVEFMRRPAFSRTLLLISAVPILWRVGGSRFGRQLPWALCIIVAFDLVTFSSGVTGYARPAEIFPDAPLFEFLKQQGNPFTFRIADFRGAILMNSPLVYGVSAADGYEVVLERARNFSWDYSAHISDAVALDADRFFQQNDRRMDMLNLRFFIVGSFNPEFKEFAARKDRYSLVFNDGVIGVYENLRALPRVFAVPLSGAELIEDMPNQFIRLRDPNFDPQGSVIISSLVGIPQRGREPGGSFDNKLDIIATGVNGFSLQATVSKPAILVVSQSYYPGWKALVDGHEVPVFDVDYALTGFPIPEGTHQVNFVFYSGTFRLGLILTCMTAIILGMMAVGFPDSRLQLVWFRRNS